MSAPLACTRCGPTYREQVERINGPIMLQQFRAGQSLPADHFVTWRFCPWCGSLLTPTECATESNGALQTQCGTCHVGEESA